MRSSHPPPPVKSGFPLPEDDNDTPRPAASGGGLRKKATGVRPWLLLDAAGQAQVVEAGKHAIMRRTGLPARDLRILDPLLSYPSTVLGRERAIVINLEHIKAIITAQEVLLLNSRDPSVMPFVEELQRRILRHHHATKSQEGGFNADDTDWTNLFDLVEPISRSHSPQKFSEGFPGNDDGGKVDGVGAFDKQDGLKVLPFEFIALEACLEAACSCLENEARTLEQEAHPALDKLTSKISTLNLERVRQIKSRLVAITGRVQKVRDELEQLLDDDEDMAEMYLTDKMVQQHLENSSQPSMDEHDGIDDDVARSNMDDSSIPAAILSDVNGASTSFEGNVHNIDNTQEQLYAASHVLRRDSHGTHTSTTHSVISKHLDVEELEMLLEAYFVQIDGTLNKLSTLREYVDDTEDYINIMLDDKQNHLLQMGVMLTTATLVVSAFVVVAGIFGMNIQIDLFSEEKAGMQEFLWTVGGGATGSVFLYVIAIAWCKHKRLLE
ncbi:magnesium transporter MRS2-3 [Rhododendron vialii]|uniref:magnesium transporter MRS2-3 n=1 Tax=Rhododendron vialii TaxID=182163 RepID=UPI00265FFC39|nr:magnesium transporter MRS2-3 [Rhododendron vialii]